MKKVLFLMLGAVLCMTLLCSCAAGVSGRSEEYRAGFFTGIWHGWIAPVTLIWQLFNHNVRIYEVHNTGWTYDFGFYIAIIAGFGGLALTRKRCKK